MFRVKKISLLTAAALAISGAFVATTSAAVVSDNFEADSVNSPPANWVAHGGSIALNTVVDSTTSSNVMDVNQTATGTQYAAISFPTAVSLADGQSLTLSFDVAVQTATPLAVVDRGFRAGIYNSSASSPSGGPFTNATVGYLFRVDEGTNTPAGSDHVLDVRESPGALSSSSTNGGSVFNDNTASNQIDDNLYRTITLTLTRSGDSLNVDLSIDKSGGLTAAFSGTDNSSAVFSAIANSGYTFDEVLIGSTSTLDYHIDNVNVTTSSVPEPASLGVLGIGALAVLKRRRKA